MPDVFNLAVPTVGKRESKLPFCIVKKLNPSVSECFVRNANFWFHYFKQHSLIGVVALGAKVDAPLDIPLLECGGDVLGLSTFTGTRLPEDMSAIIGFICRASCGTFFFLVS